MRSAQSTDLALPLQIFSALLFDTSTLACSQRSLSSSLDKSFNGCELIFSIARYRSLNFSIARIKEPSGSIECHLAILTMQNSTSPNSSSTSRFASLDLLG